MIVLINKINKFKSGSGKSIGKGFQLVNLAGNLRLFHENFDVLGLKTKATNSSVSPVSAGDLPDSSAHVFYWILDANVYDTIVDTNSIVNLTLDYLKADALEDSLNMEDPLNKQHVISLYLVVNSTKNRLKASAKHELQTIKDSLINLRPSLAGKKLKMFGNKEIDLFSVSLEQVISIINSMLITYNFIEKYFILFDGQKTEEDENNVRIVERLIKKGLSQYPIYKALVKNYSVKLIEISKINLQEHKNHHIVVLNEEFYKFEYMINQTKKKKNDDDDDED